MCEAFFRIHPHFGLWLKTFNVKPKVVRGTQAECGGAMVGKMPNVLWFEGSFVESLKGWQSGWFYITEPCDTNWVAAPEFRSGIPMWLTSWEKKGLAWGEPTELTGLETCIKSMRDKKIKLVTHDPGHARSADSPVPKTGIRYVGVRSGRTPDAV